MIRKHKLYSRPKHAFDAERIKEEDKIVSAYGLKNKEEIWKAQAKLKLIRSAAKKMIHESEDRQTEFIEKLKKLGYNVENPVEVLSLTEEDVLKRRLQTIVLKKNLATTAKGARQLITHKHVSIDEQVVNIPSYPVKVEEENKITLIKKNKKPKVKEAQPEAEVSETVPAGEEKKEEPKTEASE